MPELLKLTFVVDWFGEAMVAPEVGLTSDQATVPPAPSGAPPSVTVPESVALWGSVIV